MPTEDQIREEADREAKARLQSNEERAKLQEQATNVTKPPIKPTEVVEPGEGVLVVSPTKFFLTLVNHRRMEIKAGVNRIPEVVEGTPLIEDGKITHPYLLAHKVELFDPSSATESTKHNAEVNERKAELEALEAEIATRKAELEKLPEAKGGKGKK